MPVCISFIQRTSTVGIWIQRSRITVPRIDVEILCTCSTVQYSNRSSTSFGDANMSGGGREKPTPAAMQRSSRYIVKKSSAVGGKSRKSASFCLAQNAVLEILQTRRGHFSLLHRKKAGNCFTPFLSPSHDCCWCLLCRHAHSLFIPSPNSLLI